MITSWRCWESTGNQLKNNEDDVNCWNMNFIWRYDQPKNCFKNVVRSAFMPSSAWCSLWSSPLTKNPPHHAINWVRPCMSSVPVALFPLVLTINQQCLSLSYNNKKLLKFFSKGDKQSLWKVLFFYYSSVGQIFFTWDNWETANSPIQPCKYL